MNIIIGNGVAGISAALTIRKNNEKPRSRAARYSGCQNKQIPITVISRETEYYFSRTALMYIAMNEMRLEDTEPYERDFYKKHNINLVYENVISIDSKAKSIKLGSGKTLKYSKLLIATGAVPVKPGLPGINLDGVVHFVSYQDLTEVMEKAKTAKKAVVIGGGPIGIELVEVLNALGVEVTFLIRDKWYWASNLSEKEAIFVQNLMQKRGINLIFNECLKSINGSNNKVKSITTENRLEIPCDIAGITVGVKPCIALNSGIPCSRGILVDRQLRTKVNDIYAAGDCVELELPGNKKNLIWSMWYIARDMGIIAGKNMLGASLEYAPGEYYNSAKFFNKEYTVVGCMGPLNKSEKDYFYEDNENILRVTYNEKKIQGISLIGSRCDHEKLINMIKSRITIDEFLNKYREAEFNPEFMKLPELQGSFLEIS